MPSDDQTLQWRHVAITGASSGIGAALARRLAAPGRRLSLAGRNIAWLNNVARDCTAQGAESHATLLDVSNGTAVAAWLDDTARELSIDLVLCNAGLHEKAGPTPQRAVEVNLLGAINTIGPAAALMRDSGGGRIAVMISPAIFRPQPKEPADMAGKAAVGLYAEGMREALHSIGIDLSVVWPGVVATPMITGHQVPLWFRVSADCAAEIIVTGLTRGRPLIYFPWLLYAKAQLLASLPTSLVEGRFARPIVRQTRQ